MSIKKVLTICIIALGVLHMPDLSEAKCVCTKMINDFCCKTLPTESGYSKNRTDACCHSKGFEMEEPEWRCNKDHGSDCEKDADCTNGRACQRCQCHKGTIETSQYSQGLPEGSDCRLPIDEENKTYPISWRKDEHIPCTSNCINDNVGFPSLEEAWNACKIIEPCAYITKNENTGTYYLRRREDQWSKEDKKGWKSIEYECTECWRYDDCKTEKPDEPKCLLGCRKLNDNNWNCLGGHGTRYCGSMEGFRCSEENDVCKCHGKVNFGFKGDRRIYGHQSEMRDVRGVIGCERSNFVGGDSEHKRRCWCYPSSEQCTIIEGKPSETVMEKNIFLDRVDTSEECIDLVKKYPEAVGMQWMSRFPNAGSPTDDTRRKCYAMYENFDPQDLDLRYTQTYYVCKF